MAGPANKRERRGDRPLKRDLTFWLTQSQPSRRSQADRKRAKVKTSMRPNKPDASQIPRRAAAINLESLESRGSPRHTTLATKPASQRWSGASEALHHNQLGRALRSGERTGDITAPEPRSLNYETLYGVYSSAAEGYLLDVKFHPDTGRAVALIWDPKTGRITRWIDRTGHRPYFLVNLRPEEAGAPERGVTRHPDFEKFDIVIKFNPITRQRVTMTKVVVRNPLAVRSLREKFNGPNEGAWEADIRYHHNYIYDHELIPGMPYRVSAKWAPLGWDARNVEWDKLKKVLGENPDAEVARHAAVWIPIFEVPPPTPCIASLDIEVHTPARGHVPDPDLANLPIISIAVSRSDGSSKVFLLGAGWQSFESIPDDVDLEIYDSEAALILDALIYASACPVLTTFNGDSFDLPYIYNRLLMLGVPEDLIPIEVGSDHATVEWGVHVDLYKLFDIKALQAYAFGGAYREKGLDDIARALLNEGKVELPDTVSNVPLDLLVRYNMRDARITLRLLVDKERLVWNLIVLLMRISKLGIEDVTRTQVSGWIKSLMHWEHRRRGFLIPRKADIEEIGRKRTTQAIIKDKKYKGALVLEPPVGVFFNIIVLDFASLYPSIIKNWNLSYETVDNPYCPESSRKPLPGVGHYVCTSIRGLTSEIVGLLRDFRVRVYKKLAKDPSLPPQKREWFNIVQSSMKVFINASYGVFGNEQFNFFSLALAESVTGIGRTILTDSLRKASQLNLHILYGDTDSLFVWSPRRDALEELIRYVNEKYGLDLEVDKTFKAVIFSGLKKNYIGITESGDVIIKGMMGKKRNMPIFIREAFSEAVRLLSSINGPDDVFDTIRKLKDYIKDVYGKLKSWEYTLDDLAFHVTLTKDPREYTKNTPQHVKAAMQLARHGLQVSKGDIIAFVKTKTSSGVKPVELATIREVDISKYVEHLRTAFEQMLAAFGLTWDDITGLRSLRVLLGGL
jgi:DNA polymerase I